MVSKKRSPRFMVSPLDRKRMTNQNFPFYIVSKGRADTMLTSRSLSRMKVPHYITVEPQDFDPYTEALEKFNLKDYATLLLLPFSNHGDGPGRARNWAWDHSMSIGAEKHWVADDNIDDFYRLHKNLRIRVESGAYFKACEDFIGRYENLHQDWTKVCDKIKEVAEYKRAWMKDRFILPRHYTLPHMRNRKEQDHTRYTEKPYQEYYTKEMKEMVEEIYQNDIVNFNYKFE